MLLDTNEKQSLTAKVYNHIRDGILDGTYPIGGYLVETRLAEELAVSRTPVREALKQLESEGLVRHFPSRGTFVTNLTVQDVDEIFQLRELFEITSLKNAVHEITEAELDYIEERLRYLDDKRSEEPPTKETFYNSDRELHALIMKYSGNSRMIKFHKTLEVQLEQLRRISAMTPMRLVKSRQEHLDIIYALRSRDLANATRALLLHLQNIKASTLNVCRNMSSQC